MKIFFLFSFLLLISKIKSDNCGSFTNCYDCSSHGCGWCDGIQFCLPIDIYSSCSIVNSANQEVLSGQSLCQSYFNNSQFITNKCLCENKYANCRSQASMFGCTSESDCIFCNIGLANHDDSVPTTGVCFGNVSSIQFCENNLGGAISSIGNIQQVNCAPAVTSQCSMYTGDATSCTQNGCGFCKQSVLGGFCMNNYPSANGICTCILQGTEYYPPNSNIGFSLSFKLGLGLGLGVGVPCVGGCGTVVLCCLHKKGIINLTRCLKKCKKSDNKEKEEKEEEKEEKEENEKEKKEKKKKDQKKKDNKKKDKKDKKDQKNEKNENVLVKNRVGEGHFGEVYLGIWNETEIVALKHFKDESRTKEITAEIEKLKTLKHTNIVAIYGLHTENGKVYFLTELMPQGRLDKLFCKNKHKFKPGHLLSLALQAANGMEYLAQNDIVHKNLALRNLLVTFQGKNNQFLVKVSDVGFVGTLQNVKSNAHFPFKWAAPEAYEKDTFSLKSDVWSFGIVLWELFSYGKEPYPGMSNEEVIQQVPKGHRNTPENCSENINNLMQQCWSYEPEKRSSFTDIIKILEEERKAHKSEGTVLEEVDIELEGEEKLDV